MLALVVAVLIAYDYECARKLSASLFLGSQKQAFLASWLWALIVYICVYKYDGRQFTKKINFTNKSVTKNKRTKQIDMATRQQIWAGPKFIHVRGAELSSLVFHALV